MKAMAVNLKPEHIETEPKSRGGVRRPSVDSTLIELRHGIADIRVVEKNRIRRLRIKTTSSAWKNLLSGRKNLPELLANGRALIKW